MLSSEETEWLRELLVIPRTLLGLLLCFSIFGIGRDYFESSRTKQIEREGLQVVGRVTERWIQMREDKKDEPYPVRWLTFDFAVEGLASVRDQRSVSAELYRKTKVGSPIRLIYLRDDPRQLYLVGEFEKNGRSFAGGLFCLVVGLINFLLWFPWEKRRTRRMMVSPPPSPPPLPTAPTSGTGSLRAGDMISGNPEDELPSWGSPAPDFSHDVPEPTNSADDPGSVNHFDSIVEVWRSLITDKTKSWVVFQHGTCVILMQPQADLAAQATAILRESGGVQAGTSSGDFQTMELDGREHGPMGFVVTGHHPDILNYVAPGETERGPFDLWTGYRGRHKRAMDSEQPGVIHVEDNRPQ